MPRWITGLLAVLAALVAAARRRHRTIRAARSLWSCRSRPAAAPPIVARIVADKLGEVLGQQFIIDNRGGAGGTVGTRAVANARARRLHHPARLYRHAGHRSEPLPQRRLRPAQGFRADRPDRHRAEHAGGASLVPGQIGRRAGRLCQGQSGQGQLRLGRRRHRQPCLRRIFRDRRRHQAHAHSLQGHRAGARRSARRPHPDGVRADSGHPREHQDRQAAHAGGDQRGALDAGAGGADHRRARRRRLRGGAALWPGGAGRHAAPDLDKLNKALNEVLASDDVRKRLAIEGAEPLPSTPEQYAADIDREETKWSKVVKASGAKAE